VAHVELTNCEGFQVAASISFAIVELLGTRIKRCPTVATKYCKEKKMKSNRASYYHYSENERRVELLWTDTLKNK